MKLLAIVPSLYDISPGQRYRIEQWEPILREKGVEITYSPFETEELRGVLYQPGRIAEKMKFVMRSINKRREDMRNVRDFDAVYVFREAALLGPAYFEKSISRSGVPMIFDFDDAVFVSYKSPSNGYLSYLKFPGKTATICRLSAHIMAGNPYLAEYARQYNPKNVTVIPTTIDTDKYHYLENRPANDVPVIGWSGSHSTVQHLDTLRETLQDLAKVAQFRLRVIGTPNYKIEGVDVEAMAWRSETETQDLEPIDVGVMPLPDDQWSKGKCGLKALQYMALGVPTICSPVGVNSDIIQDGENGFLADGKEEWIEKLKRLLASAELRRKLGAAGRRTVEEKYSARVQAPRVFQILTSVVNRAKTTDKKAIRQTEKQEENSYGSI
ncbi:MAG TPA: glycosyltransferase family 4 protein [Pyrinomonadaceae bacterium]|nr:glycosyltransferase family 4 protein [Pyrinomonadaceae bacterium]